MECTSGGGGKDIEEQLSVKDKLIFNKLPKIYEGIRIITAEAIKCDSKMFGTCTGDLGESLAEILPFPKAASD